MLISVEKIIQKLEMRQKDNYSSFQWQPNTVALKTCFSINIIWEQNINNISIYVCVCVCVCVCVYLCFFPLLFDSLLFKAICKASSDNHFAFLPFFFLGLILIPLLCTMTRTSVHSSSGTLSIRSNPLNLFLTSTV